MCNECYVMPPYFKEELQVNTSWGGQSQYSCLDWATGHVGQALRGWFQGTSRTLPLHKRKAVLGITLNYIWWFSCKSETLGCIEHPFIAITLKSTLSWRVSIHYSLILESNRSVLKLSILDRNTWYYITVYSKNFGTVEYIDCIYAEGLYFPNECPGYDTKQSDGEIPVMLELWGTGTTT